MRGGGRAQGRAGDPSDPGGRWRVAPARIPKLLQEKRSGVCDSTWGADTGPGFHESQISVHRRGEFLEALHLVRMVGGDVGRFARVACKVVELRLKRSLRARRF